MREVNLIGGFYRDEPFSAQDTVNWLPVQAQAEGTRSPIKLRGAPGLVAVDGSVESLVIPGLFTENTAWLGLPPQEVVSEAFGLTANSGLFNFAVGALSIQRNSNLSAPLICRRSRRAAPWPTAIEPYGGLSGAIASISASGNPGMSWRGSLLAIAYASPQSTVRIFQFNGASWSEFSMVGGSASVGMNLPEFSDSGNVLVAYNSSTGDRYRVFGIDRTESRFTQLSADGGAGLDAINSISWLPGSESVFVSGLASTGGIEVVEATPGLVTRRQTLSRPAGATGACIHVRFTSRTRFIACWESSLATPVYVYSFDPDANTAALIGAAPWQPGEGTSVTRNFSSPRSGAYLAYCNGNFPTPRVVNTATLAELTIPAATLPSNAIRSWWADNG